MKISILSAFCYYLQFLPTALHLPHPAACRTLFPWLLSRFSRVQLLATPWTAAHQAPLSMGFFRQEYWSGLPSPSPMHEGEKWKRSSSVLSDSEQPHGLQPTRLLRPWDFPGKSTGVGCHHLLWPLTENLPKEKNLGPYGFTGGFYQLKTYHTTLRLFQKLKRGEHFQTHPMSSVLP